MTSRLTLAAPAKVNLFLHVLGRRADGYHLLDSLIAFAAIGDRIEIAPAAELSLAIEGPFAAGLSAGEDNLVLRAAHALRAAAPMHGPGAAIRLVKNLPVASGIGGGSADAAATLEGLNALWGLGMDPAALARIGLGLGADVPVCLFGRAARMGGIGEAIAPAPQLPGFAVLLVNPGVPVPTGSVFKALQGRYSARAPDPPTRTDAPAFAGWLAAQRNDLSAPAIAGAPVIAQALTAIEATERCLLARLSGSGATCFGLYPDSAAAEAAARQVRNAHPDWWVAATRFLEERRHPVACGGTAAQGG